MLVSTSFFAPQSSIPMRRDLHTDHPAATRMILALVSIVAVESTSVLVSLAILTFGAVAKETNRI